MFRDIVSLIIVSLLWGGTNPFIKRGSKDITTVKGSSMVEQFILEVKYLATNFQYLLPMTLNQCGSLLYFLTLQSADLSLAVPVANSLTFVFTALSGWMLGEKTASKNTYIGMMLVLSGTLLCCWDKYTSL